MMMKQLKLLMLLLAAALAFCGCGDDENDYNLGGGTPPKTEPTGTPGESGNNNTGEEQQSEEARQAAATRLEFPRTTGTNGSFVVVHTAVLNSRTGEKGINYCVEWDPVMHAQRWCCYQMYGSLMQTNTSRYSGDRTVSLTPESAYPNDPFISEAYQFTRDPFWSTGYDHGHICPSADRLASAEANYQTFFLTNMMPQVNAFNSGIWASMEKWVRDRTYNFDTLYVCKGGTIDKEENIMRYLGSAANKIPVPRYFFMAVMGRKGDTFTAMGFWIEHSGAIPSDDDLSQYVVNVRELERLTGLDFFCNLPDDVEESVETLPLGNVKANWKGI